MKWAKPKIQETNVIPQKMKLRQDTEEVGSKTWVGGFV